MGLEVGGKGDTKEKKKEEEKIPYMYENIGHRPLWDHCPNVLVTFSITALAHPNTTGVAMYPTLLSIIRWVRNLLQL